LFAHRLSTQSPERTMQAETLDQHDVDHAVDVLLKKIEIDEILDEVAEAGESFMVAIEKGDAAMVGRLVLNVRRAYATRLALREMLDGGMDANSEHYSAQRAAAVALVGAVL
jgi:hypothetical protein